MSCLTWVLYVYLWLCMYVFMVGDMSVYGAYVCVCMWVYGVYVWYAHIYFLCHVGGGQRASSAASSAFYQAEGGFFWLVALHCELHAWPASWGFPSPPPTFPQKGRVQTCTTVSNSQVGSRSAPERKPSGLCSKSFYAPRRLQSPLTKFFLTVCFTHFSLPAER